MTGQKDRPLHVSQSCRSRFLGCAPKVGRTSRGSRLIANFSLVSRFLLRSSRSAFYPNIANAQDTQEQPTNINRTFSIQLVFSKKNMPSTVPAVADQEVTEEEFCSQASSSSTTTTPSKKTKGSRDGLLLFGNRPPRNNTKVSKLNMTNWKTLVGSKKKRRQHSHVRDDYSEHQATSSVEGGGGQSVAVMTTTSLETVKRSNRTPFQPTPAKSINDKSTHTKNLGQRLKQQFKLVKVRSLQIRPSRSMTDANDDESSLSGLSSGYPLRDRVQSEDFAGRRNKTSSTWSTRQRSKLDLAIRGRFDGLDTLTIGPVRLECVSGLSAIREQSNESENSSTTTKNETIPTNLSQVSFTGRPTTCTAGDLVADMIWASGGLQCCELILEGYNPGDSDRWSVRIEEPISSSDSDDHNSIAEAHTFELSQQCFACGGRGDDESTADLTEDTGSPILPMDRMWQQIWGGSPPPIPTHLQTTDHNNDTNEEILQLTANCSVPVDIDEDAFIVEGPEHLRAVHDLVEVPLRVKRFDSALLIFEKLLTGLENSTNEKLKHLIGGTNHNIGLVCLCHQNYLEAVSAFEKAVQHRVDRLPANHPDIGVSLVRLGVAQFATEKFQEAEKSLESALALFTVQDGTRAKILNSMGAVLFFQQKYDEALKVYTGALEIFRKWLEGPVRRETMIYDASMALSSMGKVYEQTGQLEMAFCMHEEAFLVSTTTSFLMLRGRNQIIL